jgi:hypothetical protein
MYRIKICGKDQWLFGNISTVDDVKQARKFETKEQAETHIREWFTYPFSFKVESTEGEADGSK